MVGLIGNKMNLYATVPNTGARSGSTWMDGSQVDDWHTELTKRIAVLEERGGGTLELWTCRLLPKRYIFIKKATPTTFRMHQPSRNI